MSVTPIGDRRVALASPCRVPVPGSTVVAEVLANPADHELGGGALTAAIRCEVCDRRQFDLTVDQGARLHERAIVIERKCPRCGLLCRGRVTAVDGQRIFGPGVLVDTWSCECGQRLGHVDEIRGRIRTSCRCRHAIRVTAAVAVLAASRVHR
ncbi:MAG: hypothetical protein U0075_23595 [Thermomicrobiales bacterium]